MNDFSERLKALRIDKRMQQREVAEALGVALRTYQSYEYGEHEPSMAMLHALADHLGVSADYLLGNAEAPPDTDAGSDVKVEDDMWQVILAELTDIKQGLAALNAELETLREGIKGNVSGLGGEFAALQEGQRQLAELLDKPALAANSPEGVSLRLTKDVEQFNVNLERLYHGLMAIEHDQKEIRQSLSTGKVERGELLNNHEPRISRLEKLLEKLKIHEAQ